jgi:transposase
VFACTATTRIFLALDTVDLRQSFNELCAYVQQRLAEDPLSGHLYLFSNRARNRVKILTFDGSGLWVATKRIEGGRVGWPTGEGAQVRNRAEGLPALLCGLDVRPRRGYRREQQCKKP